MTSNGVEFIVWKKYPALTMNVLVDVHCANQRFHVKDFTETNFHCRWGIRIREMTPSFACVRYWRQKLALKKWSCCSQRSASQRELMPTAYFIHTTGVHCFYSDILCTHKGSDELIWFPGDFNFTLIKYGIGIPFTNFASRSQPELRSVR